MAQLSMCRKLAFVLAFVIKVAFSATVEVENVDSRRPIWNIAHMVNTLYQVNHYLDRGANSLEFDVAFDTDGSARFVYHGIPCDCFRRCLHYEYFNTYINYLRQLTTPEDPLFREELVLLFLDLKLSGLTRSTQFRAGQDVAAKLMEHYWRQETSDARAYILISVPSYIHMGFIKGFIRTLEDKNATLYKTKIGFDFSGNEAISQILSALEAEGISNHIWLGDGITNCLPRGTSRLVEALNRRDETGETDLNKVYWWTVDRRSTMRRTLELGVDGIITNYPERLISILNEDDISSYVRIATYEDNPWKTHPQSFAKIRTFSLKNTEGNFTEAILWN